MKNSVLCIANSYLQADRIIRDLQGSGFASTEISVLSSDSHGNRGFAHVKSSKAPEGAAGGALVGGVTGGLVGLLAGIGTLAIPGLGALIAAGPILATLSGAVDNYASGAGHNANFFLRPSDGRALYLPHDLDFYGGSPQSPVVASPDLAKLIASPERARRYYAHLLDIITTSYNGTYMSGWCSHLGQLLPGQDFASHLRFITARADWVLNTAPDAVLKAVPRVAFAITTGGAPLAVTTPTVALAGNAWLDIAAVRRVGAPGALALTFTGRSTWQATVPVACGNWRNRASTMQPEPVPRSRMRATSIPVARTVAASISTSVSGRGTSTPGRIASSKSQNGAEPRM